MSGAFIGPYLWGVRLKKGMNVYGAWASVICAMLITLAGISGLSGLSAPMTGAAAIVCSLTVSPLVSALFSRRAAKKTPQAPPEARRTRNNADRGGKQVS